MFKNIRADMKRYAKFQGWAKNTGFWITLAYRFGAWSHTINIFPFRLICLVMHRCLAFPWRFFKDVFLPARAKIGPGFCMLHPHSIYIPPNTTIGVNCTVYQEVTMGTGPIPGVPELGDNVELFVGAKILGGLFVGNNVTVGANAVVINDVPAGSLVLSPLCRVIPHRTMKAVKVRYTTETAQYKN